MFGFQNFAGAPLATALVEGPDAAGEDEPEDIWDK